MESKKTKKVMMMLVTVAILIFAAVLYFNNHLDSKEDISKTDFIKDELALISGAKQSYMSSNNPVLEEDDFYVGQKDASLKVFIYEDYSDIFSAELNQSLAKAKTDFANDILFIFRPFNTKHDLVSVELALGVVCAAEQNKAEAWRELDFQALMDNSVPLDSFDSWIDDLELNDNDFQLCLTNQLKKERIEGVSVQAASYSVYGAPTMFVGDEMIVGARPYQTFIDSNGDEIEGLKQVIERQLK